MTRRYSTIEDVVEQVVRPSLGQYEAEYDVYAIAHTAYTYRVDRDAQGRELLDFAGFEQVVSEEEYWAIVAANVTPTIDEVHDL